MPVSSPVAADVPGIFDVLLNGNGFVFANTENERAVYGFSPTFVPRQNTSGNYGDSQHDFWMVLSQNDWSLGEQQRYIRLNDEDSRRRYWRGERINITTEGEITPVQDRMDVTIPDTVLALTGPGSNSATIPVCWAVTDTNVYSINAIATATDVGAHGLAAIASVHAVASSGASTAGQTFIYVTNGSVVNRISSAGGSASFSATGAYTLHYHNNLLYGLRADGDFVSWSTAGAETIIFTWKNPHGQDIAIKPGAMASLGGDLILLLTDNGTGRSELWRYTGSATARIASFPGNFRAHDLTVSGGVLYIGGSFVKNVNADNDLLVERPAVFFYVNDTLDRLWQADGWGEDQGSITSVGQVAVEAFEDGVVFYDHTTDTVKFSNARTGAVSSIATFAHSAGIPTPMLAVCATFFVLSMPDDTMLYPDSDGVAQDAYVQTSLFDGDSSLKKLFKSIRIDASIPDGAQIDVYYRLNDLDDTYTLLQSDAIPGTEYALGQVAQSVSVKIVFTGSGLYPSSSTYPSSTTYPGGATGATLRRIYVRAAPIQPPFKKRRYIIDCSGKDGETHVALRNGQPHPADGKTLASRLAALALLESPFTITDRFGTFTGLVDVSDEFNLIEIRPDEFVCTLSVRET